jgi:hypothetical protein
MADNVAITAGAGTTIAADDIAGVLHQRVKISQGADGSATDVSSAAPLNTLLTNLELAEDAAHSSGDKGVMALAVRQDTAAALSGTDADYTPLITDANGRLHVLDANSAAIKTAVELIDDVVFAEDAAHSDGNKGIMALTVRKNTAAATSGADGDYQPLVTDTNGRLHVNSVVATLPDTRESWRISTLTFTAANDSDNTFTVPATTEYQVLSIYVSLASTATVGNRQMSVLMTDTSDVTIGELRAGATQAASLTRIYQWGPGLPQDTAFRDTSYISQAMMPIWLGAGDKLRIYDKAAVDAAADDMIIKIQVASRSIA